MGVHKANRTVEHLSGRRGVGASRRGGLVAAQSFISSRAAVIREVTDDHIIMVWERSVCVVWKRATTLAGIEKLSSVYKEQAVRYPDGIYLLTIVEPTAPLPPPEAREALAIFLRSGGGRTRLSAVVHEGNGFRAAAVRSVVTGLAMLVRLPYPHEIFATVDQAARWLANGKHKDVDAEYTVLAVTHARRTAEERNLHARGQ